MNQPETYYNPRFRILFTKIKNRYEPTLIDCDEVEIEDCIRYEGVRISKNSIYYAFILFVRECTDRFDKTSGLPEPGFLEFFQWYIALQSIKCAMNLKSEDGLLAVARQGGKSHVGRIIMAFCTIFVPMYTYVKETRYCSAWASPTTKLSLDHLAKLKPYFKTAILLFNKMFSESPIITKDEDRDIQENKTIMEFNRETPNGVIPYSSFYLLSLNSRVINAGYSLNLIISDESQECNAERFNEQLQPTTMKTGGIVLTLGTTLPSADNLLYQVYKKESIPSNRKILIDVKEVYELMKIRSESEAEQYWRRYELEVREKGINSDYIQSQYWVSFTILGSRFITVEKMQQLNIFNIPELGMNRTVRRLALSKDSFYRIGAIDSARKSDMAAFIGGICHVYTNDDGSTKYRIYATDFVEINKDERSRGTIISPDDLASRSSSLCQQFQLDMLMYDSSAQQSDRAYSLHTMNKRKNVNTLIVPYDYGGRNKETMFLYFEDSLNNNSINLPDLKNTEISEEYNEFIEEIAIFKKEYTGSTIKFAAPNVRGCHDDFIAALAQLVYLPKYVEKCEDNGKTSGLSEMEDYDIKFSRYNDLEDNNSMRTVHYYR